MAKYILKFTFFFVKINKLVTISRALEKIHNCFLHAETVWPSLNEVLQTPASPTDRKQRAETLARTELPFLNFCHFCGNVLKFLKKKKLFVSQSFRLKFLKNPNANDGSLKLKRLGYERTKLRLEELDKSGNLIQKCQPVDLENHQALCSDSQRERNKL